MILKQFYLVWCNHIQYGLWNSSSFPQCHVVQNLYDKRRHFKECSSYSFPYNDSQWWLMAFSLLKYKALWNLSKWPSLLKPFGKIQKFKSVFTKNLESYSCLHIQIWCVTWLDSVACYKMFENQSKCTKFAYALFI